MISSTLKRAYQTAEIISNNTEIIKDDRIIERCNGELEGTLKSEMTCNIDFNDINGSGHGIENIVDFKNRIIAFFDEIIMKYNNKNILIVIHAGVCIYARYYFEGEPLNNDYSIYKLKNCDVCKYDNKKYSKLKKSINKH